MTTIEAIGAERTKAVHGARAAIVALKIEGVIARVCAGTGEAHHHGKEAHHHLQQSKLRRYKENHCTQDKKGVDDTVPGTVTPFPQWGVGPAILSVFSTGESARLARRGCPIQKRGAGPISD